MDGEYRDLLRDGRIGRPRAPSTGAPVDEIADRAALSPGTVRNYLSNAMTKLDAVNRREARATARRLGWI